MVATKNEITGRWTLSGVEPSVETFSKIVSMIRSGQKFKFARYGDGEINCMNGKQGRNCDSHEYYTDLGKRLRETVKKEPDYMVGIQPLAVSHMEESVKKYFGHFKKLYDSDAIHSASIDGRMGELFEALKLRKVILVGPSHLFDMGEWEHIVTPDRNCWLQYDEIKKQVLIHAEPDNVVLLCCGMMAEVLLPEVDATVIDIGSAFDPYVGVFSRRYHHKLKL